MTLSPFAVILAVIAIEYVNHMCTPTGLRAPESVNLIASGL